MIPTVDAGTYLVTKKLIYLPEERRLTHLTICFRGQTITKQDNWLTIPELPGPLFSLLSLFQYFCSCQRARVNPIIKIPKFQNVVGNFNWTIKKKQVIVESHPETSVRKRGNEKHLFRVRSFVRPTKSR